MLRVVEEAGVRNIQWCDLETLNPIETYMAFPGDAKFEKVKQTADRVYMLEFSANSRRIFFWMQEPDKTADEENAKKLHDCINPSFGQAASSGPSGPRLGQQTQPPGDFNAQMASFMNDPNLMQGMMQNMNKDKCKFGCSLIQHLVYPLSLLQNPLMLSCKMKSYASLCLSTCLKDNKMLSS